MALRAECSIGSHDRPLEYRQSDNPLPKFIPPQLTLLRREAPSGSQWVHEIKLDGYRIHARIDRSRVQLLTQNGLDWTERYRATEQALGKLPVDDLLARRMGLRHRGKAEGRRNEVLKQRLHQADFDQGEPCRGVG
jgi:ATP-dependent DNA ligase